jgi:hypothetical protein
VLEFVATVGAIALTGLYIAVRMPGEGLVVAGLAVRLAFGYVAVAGEARPERIVLAEAAYLVVAVEAFILLAKTAA